MEFLRKWFDKSRPARVGDRSVDWIGILPFIALHLACIAPVWVGWSATALIVALVSYLLRAFAITAFFHRGMAHKAFHTSRTVQFVFAFLATAATQRGPLWWVSHHRRHHAGADTDRDPHSPRHGFWWSHLGWFLRRGAFATSEERVPDLNRLPELRWLNRFDPVAPLLYAAGLYGIGEALPAELGTSGWQLVAWGYVIATVALMHATFMVNSLAHRHGRRPFATNDDSRNIWWLAIITFGEGWHNNHHRYAGSARLGLRWWQLDLGWLGLRLLQYLGLIRDLKPGPGRDESSSASQ